ncbi:sodium:solute symporter family transporter [Stieleria varia]|uniref:Sodium/glucose cotransporter n=1 Tax=Stieleria varia TaxID=2528005 RepID=A0A5C6A0G3_9BACT|nr:sodium/solute symporter [Stieleria varia]TWT93312.1 Sodium/glucose cotransporter [Stieleria varia]
MTQATLSPQATRAGALSVIVLSVIVLLCNFVSPVRAETPLAKSLAWGELPTLPDSIGVAGPFAGVHNDALIVAGGANFPAPTWESDKVWHDRIDVLVRQGDEFVWKPGGQLERPTAYGASVSTADGVLCIGGNDADRAFDDVFLLQWNPQTESVTTVLFPSLPTPCAFASATRVGSVVYVAGGQSSNQPDSCMNNFWSLDLSQRGNTDAFQWRVQTPWPGKSRAFNLTVAQHNGYTDCVYVISGRRPDGDRTEFLTDCWEFNPNTGAWRARSDTPRCVMAGTSVAVGQSHALVLGGDDGSLFGAELRDQHPGFPREALAYHTITDRWASAGEMPANHVTTVAVKFAGRIVIPSGEIRPRVRSPRLLTLIIQDHQHGFGVINYGVLFGYLAAMVGIGVYFTKRNRNTDDYFRGGKRIPWWAAGCSIFATMLSSLTFTGIPSKSFAQDWVYSIGNFTIPVVAIVAVYVALPFFRRIDVTSAYEYLELRFNRSVRWFGSASFVLFHLFRMAVVMSLTGLALAVATPLTPVQSVLLMGVLSIVYCTLGGIEAVIWTDTVQTFVLLGGAVLAAALLINGTDGGLTGWIQSGSSGDKFNIANWHVDPRSAQLALWVVVVGAIGQNISSYTSDQAVVQRYMTTADQRLAARSIWLNAFLAIPATILFFGIGTGLYAFYQSHPERLDPGITTDQIFPLFIATEMPIGIAGLIVAGIFSAAQSTVSTSMNSTATTVVTDFLEPLEWFKSDRGYLIAARVLTVMIGVLGTLLGLVFVDPSIKSLFDTFIQVIGMFMGVLGGLFVLGALTRRGNAAGALIGAITGATSMIALWHFQIVNGYLFTSCGITICVVVGYLVSLLTRPPQQSLDGLTVYDNAVKHSDSPEY